MYNFTPKLKPRSEKPLYEQIYLYIASEIKSGKIEAGERLPSKKSIASHLGVSVNTIETAYSILVQEGYVRSIPRKGFFVESVESPIGGETKFPREEIPKDEYRIDFKTNAVDAAAFPYSTWIKLTKEVMYYGSELLNSGDAKGDYELRESIAKYLHEFRGVKCEPSQIIVGAGMEYLTVLLSQLLGRNKVYAFENPGYKKAAGIISNTGARVLHINVDNGGLSIDELKKTDADIVYITPSHQFPTGAVMPVGRRMRLLSWAAERSGRYIIEDDYNSEFNFTQKPVPAVQGIAPNDSVIYMSTFSRVLAPSIRIAYMVLPQTLLDSYEKMFSAYSSTVSRFEQHTLDKFISGGYFQRHLNRVKNIYKKRRAAVTDMLKRAGYDYSGTGAGPHILIRTPNAKEIIQAAKERGIRLYDLDDYYFNCTASRGDAIVVGFAAVSDADIDELEELLTEMKIKQEE